MRSEEEDEDEEYYDEHEEEDVSVLRDYSSEPAIDDCQFAML